MLSGFISGASHVVGEVGANTKARAVTKVAVQRQRLGQCEAVGNTSR